MGSVPDLKGLQSNYHYYDFESVDGKEMIYDIVSRGGSCTLFLLVTSNDTIYNNIKRHLKAGLNDSQCCDIENFVLFMLDLYSTMVGTLFADELSSLCIMRCFAPPIRITSTFSRTFDF